MSAILDIGVDLAAPPEFPGTFSAAVARLSARRSRQRGRLLASVAVDGASRVAALLLSGGRLLVSAGSGRFSFRHRVFRARIEQDPYPDALSSAARGGVRVAPPARFLLRKPRGESSRRKFPLNLRKSLRKSL